jgi:bisphosphoglycerate-dependent phosphoglycerate mutase
VKNDWEQTHNTGHISKIRLGVKKRFNSDVIDAGLTQQGIVDAFVGACRISDDLNSQTSTVVFCASDLLRAQQTSLCIYHHLSRIGQVRMTMDMDRMFDQLVLWMSCKRSGTILCKESNVPGRSISI